MPRCAAVSSYRSQGQGVHTLLRENQLQGKGKDRKGPAQPARIDVDHDGVKDRCPFQKASFLRDQ
jgi:hypothetical protein